MDQEDILARLQTSEKHVVQGEVHLTRQRLLIQRMSRDGHDTQQARELLAVLEKSQAMNLAERARLLTELTERRAGRFAHGKGTST